ncbi:Aspartic protease 6 [Aphelenchoides besseyi]|nr:Aspartic protease 6 [Aphelenchoides besseyi]
MKGHYFKDFFSFGEDMRLKAAVTFGVAEELVGEDQGILGLGNAIRAHERGSSIIHEAWRQKLIDAPVFTMYLRKCPNYEDCEKYGTITIGSHDKEMCDKVVGRVKASSKSIHWVFKVASAQFGTAVISEPFKAITDTGSPDIYVPTDFYKQLAETLKATVANNGRYVVKCDVNVELTLHVNGHNYIVPSIQLLVNLHNGFCALKIMPFDRRDGAWLLGVPFGRVFCQTHNIEKRTIEFAPALTRYE